MEIALGIHCYAIGAYSTIVRLSGMLSMSCGFCAIDLGAEQRQEFAPIDAACDLAGAPVMCLRLML